MTIDKVGALVSVPGRKRSLADHMRSKYTVADLNTEIRKGETENIEQILSCTETLGDVVNKMDIGGWSPLMVAAQYDNVDIVKTIIGYGANVDFCGHQLLSPIMVAIRSGCSATVELLLNMGASPSTLDMTGQTPMMVAAQYGEIPSLDLLKGAGADVHACDNKSGMTSAHCAAQANRIDALVWLAEAGAGLNVQDAKGYTPLHHAVASQAVDAARFLLPRTNLAIVDKRGYTVFHVAVLGAGPEMITTVLGHSDEDIIDGVGLGAAAVTPLDLACERGDEGVVELLLEAGAKAEACTCGSKAQAVLAKVITSTRLRKSQECMEGQLGFQQHLLTKRPKLFEPLVASPSPQAVPPDKKSTRVHQRFR